VSGTSEGKVFAVAAALENFLRPLPPLKFSEQLLLQDSGGFRRGVEFITAYVSQFMLSAEVELN
jgi:hypothetical protein